MYLRRQCKLISFILSKVRGDFFPMKFRFHRKKIWVQLGELHLPDRYSAEMNRWLPLKDASHAETEGGVQNLRKPALFALSFKRCVSSKKLALISRVLFVPSYLVNRYVDQWQQIVACLEPKAWSKAGNHGSFRHMISHSRESLCKFLDNYFATLYFYCDARGRIKSSDNFPGPISIFLTTS